ncbi:ERI1 exoribonuclease 3-like isoform X2 [Zootermopsis nevadensis]|uniref:Prion protein-interacting protein n=2 Tax=Zootermopsis nevadensis TaxID=136037 RepID=A0A067RB33_ZOONE|nr:ERI1 exoribonuclease 3-like isoform X2 [Zootermopsis nevadensis]KDR15860.1 Prion protein-interacting protein [Zootermopsis nevadensis]
MLSNVEVVLRWCTRNYHHWKRKNLAFASSYATLADSSSPNTFWFNRSIMKHEKQQQKYDSFLVLDFEATCERGRAIEPQEIIEFPCIKINVHTGEIDDIFHQYIKPKLIPIITPFCTELTGIMQEMVNNEPYFEETFFQFQEWLEETKCFNSGNRSIFVTSGDWDLQVMLPKQCQLSNMDIPFEMKQWINIKKAFAAATGYFPRGIIDMLTKLQLSHQGRLHSGIDDCHNIATILKALIGRGFVFEETSHLKLNKI